MKRKSSIIICSLISLCIFIISGCEEEDPGGYTFTNLVMADEFDVDGAPNSNMWTFDIGRGQNGWGNNELQYYTDRTENVKVEGGNLHIIAREESFQGAQFTSARIVTRGIFEKTFGRFEASIQLPLGRGLWPALWMLGNDCDVNIWPQCGEIDIMEYRGQLPQVVSSAIHGPGYSGGNPIIEEYTLSNDRFDTGFHKFGVEWSEDFIKFYIDDFLYHTIVPADAPGEWVYDHSFYLLMNVAVGGSFVGPVGANTVFPQTMLVDYVRVYD